MTEYPHWQERPEPITSFDGKYAWLSNFYPCRLCFGGLYFKSAEAAYQAAKCKDPLDRRAFQYMTAAEAKRAGQKVRLRTDWEYRKVEIMRKILMAKFQQNPDLEQSLMSTNNRHLEEGNHWGDAFWGVYKGRGENNLGKLLMKVRADLDIPF